MKSFAFVTVAALVASAASATPLLPGGSVSPIPVYATPFTSWTPVSSVNVSVFNSPSGNFSGELRSQVFTNSPDNPYGAGFLTFAYILQNYAGSNNALGRFTVNGFAGYLIDSGTDPLTANPSYVDAFESTRQFNGDSVGWTFSDLGPYTRLQPGTSSRLFILHTNATLFDLNAASVIDGDIASATAWAPVPTPGAGALLGLGTLAALRRRR